MAQKQCPKCLGCGKIASDEDQTPWVEWTKLPASSMLAVITGAVRPLQCPRCGGTGKVTRGEIQSTESAESE